MLSKIRARLESDGIFFLHEVLYNRLYKFFNRRRFAKIGSAAYFCAGASFKNAHFISLGEGFYCGKNAWFEAIKSDNVHVKIVIGENFSGSQNVHIAACTSVNIGNDVLVGSNVLITDHNHGRPKQLSEMMVPPAQRPLIADGVLIGDGVWLGDGVVVLPGVTIGDYCIVGANSVVTSDLPAFSKCAGAPAKVIQKFGSE